MPIETLNADLIFSLIDRGSVPEEHAALIRLYTDLFFAQSTLQDEQKFREIQKNQLDRKFRVLENKYQEILEGKNIGIVANQTSVIGNTHLVDSLLSLSVDRFSIEKVFTPEHGFRGQAEAGEHVGNQTGPVSSLPLVSLYGASRKPAAADLDGLDLVVFDIQDA